MSWRRYSWKAITCCVGKGTLVLLAVVCTIGACGAGMDRLAKREVAKRYAHDARCNELKNRVEDVFGGWVLGPIDSDPAKLAEYDARVAAWRAECATETAERNYLPIWVGYAAGGFIAFGLAAMVLRGICAASISYCQAAVDTGRRPWYWLPRVGDPLPPRELRECEACGHSSPETEDEYRERLGLAPLAEAQP